MITKPDTKIGRLDSQSESMHLDCCPVCLSRHIQTCIETNAQMHNDSAHFNFDQCRDCELVFLNPRVAEDCLHEYYDKNYLPYRGAQAWGKYAWIVRNAQSKLDKARARLVAKYKDIHNETRILDIGCGQPTFLQTCKNMYGCDAMGIDFSDNGWHNTGDRYTNLNLKIAQIKDLSPSLRPDIITMWHYLEHDYDPLTHLTILRKLSKPDTITVIEVPNYDSDSRKKYGRHWAGYHTPRHTFLFSPDNLKLLLEKTGWRVVDINNQGTLDGYIVYWMSEMEQKGIDWKKDMAPEFWPYVYGMMAFKFKNLFARNKSLGIMTAIARPN